MEAEPNPPERAARERILDAAFEAFSEDGFSGASTLDIATRARVSKRNLYADFGSKHAMLLACIRARIGRMQLSPQFPLPNDRDMLAATLIAFGSRLVQETSHPTVIATFRLAIAEATRAPEIAATLDGAGRNAARNALAALLAKAQARGLVGPGAPAELAAQYLGLLWEGLMVGLLLGVAEAPMPEEVEHRAGRATAAFLQLHAPPGAA
jgi:AcrR family transcriptional regulator